MKIRIDKDGFLAIERGGKMKPQNCPYDNPPIDSIPAKCGHWCPLFGEPEFTSENVMMLGICNDKYLICDVKDFEDER